VTIFGKREKKKMAKSARTTEQVERKLTDSAMVKQVVPSNSVRGCKGSKREIKISATDRPNCARVRIQDNTGIRELFAYITEGNPVSIVCQLLQGIDYKICA
jgi:hypothetical protein